MRRAEDPLDPEIPAALEAIDATLAGEAVDPETCRASRAGPAPGRRASQRPRTRSLPRSTAGSRAGSPPRRRPRGTGSAAGAGALAVRSWGDGAGCAAIVALIVSWLVGQRRPRSPRPASGGHLVQRRGGASASRRRVGRGHVDLAAPGRAVRAASRLGRRASSPAAASHGSPVRLGRSSAAEHSAPAPDPSPSGHAQIVQSAQLVLSHAAPPRRRRRPAGLRRRRPARTGWSRTPTSPPAAAYGNAQFQLSVPSANLQPTLAALSQLQRRQRRLAHRRHPGHHRPGRRRRAAAGRGPGAAHRRCCASSPPPRSHRESTASRPRSATPTRRSPVTCRRCASCSTGRLQPDPR